MRNRPLRYATGLAALFAGVVLLTSPRTVTARTIVVTTVADNQASDGVCSLREAIVNAMGNVKSQSGAGECSQGEALPRIDVIRIEATGTIQLVGPLPDFTENVSVVGPGAYLLSIDGFSSIRPIRVDSPTDDGVFFLGRLSIENGLDAGMGGCVSVSPGDQLTLEFVEFDNCSALTGGAIGAGQVPYAGFDANLIMRWSTIRNCSATDGGGLWAVGASLTIDNSTFSGNSASNAGGAIYFNGVLNDPPPVTIKGSTFSNNDATDKGGGLTVFNAALTMESVTVADNTTTDASGAGGVWVNDVALTLNNSVLAANTAPAWADLALASAGIPYLGSFNFIGGRTNNDTVFPPGVPNANGDYVGSLGAVLDPMLSVLDNYGGPTQTHRPTLGTGNPLVDKGSCSGEDRDQRGYGNASSLLRVIDRPGVTNGPGSDGCDIGAVETSASLVVSFVDLKAYLEGAGFGPNMDMGASLGDAGLLPSNQSYDVSPWLYSGTEAVSASLTAAHKVVDWVLVDILGGNPATPPLTVKGRVAALLLGNGSIVPAADLGGGSALLVKGPAGNNYVSVCHRNHLCVMSDAAIDFTAGIGSYDFRWSAGFSGGGLPQNVLFTDEVLGDFHGLWTGDANGDGAVQALDFNQYIAETTSGASGYQSADFNLDGAVQALDFNLYLANTLAGASSQVP